MTEDEATEKWCPFARTLNGDHATNRNFLGGPTIGALCLASKCMAWRPTRWKGDGKGYCGLAGPEP